MGFSIIESVVALALLAIVLSLTTTALNASRHALTSIGSQSRHAGLVTPMRFVEQRLADAQPLYESRLGNQARIFFAGEPHRIRFLAAIQGAAFASGMYVVEFGRLGTATQAVTLRMTPYSLGPGIEVSTSYERVIDAALSHFEVRYFGADPEGGFDRWQDTWRNRNALPVAVRLEGWRGGKSTGVRHIPLRTGRTLLSSDR